MELLEITAAALILAVGFTVWRARSRRAAVPITQDLSPTAWQAFTIGTRLTLTPVADRPSMAGDYDGIYVRVRADIRRDGDPRVAALTDRDLSRGVAGTVFEASLRCEMPRGFHLRRRGAFDGIAETVVSGAPLTTGDPRIDPAWIVRAEDEAATLELLSRDSVITALASLAAMPGQAEIDVAQVRVHMPGYVVESSVLHLVLQTITATAKAVRMHRPLRTDSTGAPVGRTVPPPARMPTLPALLRRVASAGVTTKVGKEAIDAIKMEQCTLEVDVEKVTPYVTRIGIEDGHAVLGTLVGDTCRVEVHVPRKFDQLPDLQPGDRVAAAGFVSDYDHLRNRVEVEAIAVPTLVRRPTGQTPAPAQRTATGGARLRPRTPSPAPAAAASAPPPKSPAPAEKSAAPAQALYAAAAFQAAVDKLPESYRREPALTTLQSFVPPEEGVGAYGTDPELVEVLADLAHPGTSRPDKLALIERHRDARYALTMRVDRVEKTTSFRVGPDHRDGRTAHGHPLGERVDIEVRFPPSFNRELDQTKKHEVIDCIVRVAEYDAFYERPVLEVFEREVNANAPWDAKAER